MRRRRLVLRAYGRLVELVAEGHVLDLARELLPDSFRPGRGQVERSWSVHEDEPGDWVARVEGKFLGGRANFAAALDTALADMELWVAEQARGFVFLHAGCVAREGRAIVLPGLTMTGKTTIVEALGRAGADYYSDEFALVDRRGLVRPYPRPLSRRSGAIGVHRRHPADLGLTVGTSPARLALVALLRFDESTGWGVIPLSRAHAILGLLENTVPAQSRPRESLAAIERATKNAQGIRGTRGEADEAAAILLEMLSG